MARIELSGIVKRYDRVAAVDGIDLVIEPGELFFLLGPSGCGKTTLLRMIAGFIEPTGGTIRFGDRDVTRVPSNRRNTGMVFQSYALWPHMTVADNVAYGLKIRKVAAPERDQRVRAALASVRMEEYAERRPNQLSGGQQQRVALARALVVQPDVLLLDEPLSNLDAKLRLEMRHEIRRLCTETGITTIYVTHDQKEALSMADRVAVLDAGKVRQVGPPRHLYTRPSSVFVADFLGETNRFPGTVEDAEGGRARVRLEVGGVAHGRLPEGVEPEVGASVVCCIRPEAILEEPASSGTAPASADRTVFEAALAEDVYLGDIAQRTYDVAGGTRVTVTHLHPGLDAPTASGGTGGKRWSLSARTDDVVVIPAGS